MRNICILILLLINSKAWSQKISVDTNIIFVGQQAEIVISNNIKNSEFWPNFNDTLVNGLEIVQSDFDTLSEEIIQKIIITTTPIKRI